MNKNNNFKRASRLGFAAAALAAGTMLGSGVSPAHAGPVLCNPNPKPAFSVDDGSGYEVGGAAAVLVRLSHSACTSVKVHLATSDIPGSAVGGVDYTPVSVDVTIPATKTYTWVYIPLAADPDNGPDETFRVTLSNPVGGTILDGMGTVTIIEGSIVPQ